MGHSRGVESFFNDVIPCQESCFEIGVGIGSVLGEYGGDDVIVEGSTGRA